MPLARLAFVLLLVAPRIGEAQDAAAAPARKAGGELPPIVKSVLRPLLTSFESPLHIIIAGAAPGGGIGAGLGYTNHGDTPWKLGVKALYTMRHYWNTEADLEYRGDRTHVDAYARLRDMSQLNFYGIGNTTSVVNRTAFAMREGVAGTFATVRVAPWITLGGRVEENWATLGAGRSGLFPSIDTRFSGSDVPGMAGQAKYGRYEGSMTVRVPAALGRAFYQGANYRITYALFDDQLTNRFTFTRLDLEAQQRFAVPIAGHTLTLHGWASTTSAGAGQDVPFYLQRTLGGKSFVRSVRDDVLGSDGSIATLRGFSELRFRDRNSLLLQAEYRIPIWALFDATVYVDAGKVASERSGLGIADLHHDIGFSLSIMKGDHTAARADVAFGGGEGTRILLTLGREIMR